MPCFFGGAARGGARRFKPHPPPPPPLVSSSVYVPAIYVINKIDQITLDVSGTVIERLDVPATGAATAGIAQEAMDEDDEEVVAGPIAIAVDVGDAELVPGDNP